MNRDRIEERWKQIGDRTEQQGKQRGKLTDDPAKAIAVRQDKLLGALQVNYGLARDSDSEAPRHRGDTDSIRRIARENADLIGR